MRQTTDSEIIFDDDGRIYHLHLKPDDIAYDIILVGDPDRVPMVATFLDQIIFRTQKREFNTITGIYQNRKLTVLSTGIGTDNIDIVLNELFVLHRISSENRRLNGLAIKPLNLYRIGTSGSVNDRVKIGDLLISETATGLDGLAWYYEKSKAVINQQLLDTLTQYPKEVAKPYVVSAASVLLHKFQIGFKLGHTLTCSGFYKPQGRTIDGSEPKLNRFDFQQANLDNLEMETAGIYALANHFGFNAISFNAILAERRNNLFADDPEQIVKNMIELVLNWLVKE